VTQASATARDAAAGASVRDRPKSARPDAVLTRVHASAYTVPTDRPEADGTLTWDRTTLVLAEVEAGGVRGLGYTYADRATAVLVNDKLAALVTGQDALATGESWMRMRRAVRNLGAGGVAAMAISAVDNALWDLKARLLGVSLVDLLGAVRPAILAYGSGGFTSYSEAELVEQLAGWARDGLRAVKMKVGRPDDAQRVRAARGAVGHGVALFVDANGAFDPARARAAAQAFAEHDVTWFEEPVSSDDLAGLRQVRAAAPPGMAIAAGEYGYTPAYFHQMLEACAVDVLQADATRCCGLTGFMAAAALCAAGGRPLSAHCAPSLHVAACCAAPAACHVEVFHDHARIEALLFDGAARVDADGLLRPDRARPGLGLDFKHAQAARYAA
jgi:L-alanine-DL-glutamate epimerase-like enolase superfamily enzyme